MSRKRVSKKDMQLRHEQTMKQIDNGDASLISSLYFRNTGLISPNARPSSGLQKVVGDCVRC